jgi:hypothetical protein
LPLCWVFLGSTLATLAIISGSTAFLAGTFYHAIDNYVLMAIAFFIFAGSLLSVSGIADRIVRLSYALVGRVPGGLVDVGIVAAVFMGALTGSSLPVIGALIPLLVPRSGNTDSSDTTAAVLLVELPRISHTAQRPRIAVLSGRAAVRGRGVPVHRDPAAHPAFGYPRGTCICRRYMQPAGCPVCRHVPGIDAGDRHGLP